MLASNVHAQLLDTGNLVLLNSESGATIWQSFDHPSDTVLPNMQITVSNYSIRQPVLRSWTSPSDPSVGRFSSVGNNSLFVEKMQFITVLF